MSRVKVLCSVVLCCFVPIVEGSSLDNRRCERENHKFKVFSDKSAKVFSLERFPLILCTCSSTAAVLAESWYNTLKQACVWLCSEKSSL